jgi:hypothetical protein
MTCNTFTPTSTSKKPSSAPSPKRDDVELFRAIAVVSGPVEALPHLNMRVIPQRWRLRGTCNHAVGLLAAVFLVPSVWACAAQGQAPNSAAPPSSNARITYTRTLAGSVPEYLALSVSSDGSGSYEGRPLSDPARPRALKLSLATTQKMFALASELNNFRDAELNSRKKVANLGLKTFTYESGGRKNEARFNFTQQKQARDLVDIFEKVASAEEAVDSLEYAIKYDPLSLPQELLSIQVALRNDDLAEPELMIPSLEQISSNPRFLHVAQVRAQDILKSVGRDK